MFRMLFMMTLVTSTIFAQQDAEMSSVLQDPLVNQILNEQPDSVEYYTEEKIYLKSERIHPTSKGIFLVHDESLIPLNSVRSDLRGCFIHTTELATYRCGNPKCQTVWFAYLGNKCPRCGNNGTIAH